MSQVPCLATASAIVTDRQEHPEKLFSTYTVDRYGHTWRASVGVLSGVTPGQLLLGVVRENFGAVIEIAPDCQKIHMAGPIPELIQHAWPPSVLLAEPVSKQQADAWPARIPRGCQTWFDVALGMETDQREALEEELDSNWKPEYWITLAPGSRSHRIVHSCPKDQKWMKRLIKERNATCPEICATPETLAKWKRKAHFMSRKGQMKLPCRVLFCGTGLSRHLIKRMQSSCIQMNQESIVPLDWIKSQPMCRGDRSHLKQVFALGSWVTLCRGIPRTLPFDQSDEEPIQADAAVFCMDLNNGFVVQTTLSTLETETKMKRVLFRVILVQGRVVLYIVRKQPRPHDRKQKTLPNEKHVDEVKLTTEDVDTGSRKKPRTLKDFFSGPLARRDLKQKDDKDQTEKKKKQSDAAITLPGQKQTQSQHGAKTQKNLKSSQVKSKPKPKRKRKRPDAMKYLDLDAPENDDDDDEDADEDAGIPLDDEDEANGTGTEDEEEEEEEGEDKMMGSDGYAKDGFVISEDDDDDDSNDLKHPLHEREREHGYHKQGRLEDDQEVADLAKAFGLKRKAQLTAKKPVPLQTQTYLSAWSMWFDHAWNRWAPLVSVTTNPDPEWAEIAPHELVFKLRTCVDGQFPTEAVSVAHALCTYLSRSFVVAENRSTTGLDQLMDAIPRICALSAAYHPAVGPLLLWNTVRKMTSTPKTIHAVALAHHNELDILIRTLALQILWDLAVFQGRISFQNDEVETQAFSLRRMHELFREFSTPVPNAPSAPVRTGTMGLALHCLYSTYDPCQGQCDGHVNEGSVGWAYISEVARHLNSKTKDGRPPPTPFPAAHPPAGKSSHATYSLLQALIQRSRTKGQYIASESWLSLFWSSASAGRHNGSSSSPCNLASSEDVSRRINQQTNPDPLQNRDAIAPMALFFPEFRSALLEHVTARSQSKWNTLSAQLAQITSLYADAQGFLSTSDSGAHEPKRERRLQKVEEGKKQELSSEYDGMDQLIQEAKAFHGEATQKSTATIPAPLTVLPRASLSWYDICLYFLIQGFEATISASSQRVDVLHTATSLSAKLQTLPHPTRSRPHSSTGYKPLWTRIFAEVTHRLSLWEETAHGEEKIHVDYPQHVGASRHPWVQRLVASQRSASPWSFLLLPPLILALSLKIPLGPRPPSETMAIDEDPLRNMSYGDMNVHHLMAQLSTSHHSALPLSKAKETERLSALQQVVLKGSEMWSEMDRSVSDAMQWVRSQLTIRHWKSVNLLTRETVLSESEEVIHNAHATWHEKWQQRWVVADTVHVHIQDRGFVECQLKPPIHGFVNLKKREWKLAFYQQDIEKMLWIRMGFAEIQAMLIAALRAEPQPETTQQIETLLDDVHCGRVAGSTPPQSDAKAWLLAVGFASFFESVQRALVPVVSRSQDRKSKSKTKSKTKAKPEAVELSDSWYAMAVAVLMALLTAHDAMREAMLHELWPESWFSDRTNLHTDSLACHYNPEAHGSMDPTVNPLLNSDEKNEDEEDGTGEERKLAMADDPHPESDIIRPWKLCRKTVWVEGEYSGRMNIGSEFHRQSALPRNLTVIKGFADRHHKTATFETTPMDYDDLHRLAMACYKSVACPQELDEWFLCLMLSAWKGAVLPRKTAAARDQSVLPHSLPILMPLIFRTSATPPRSQVVHILVQYEFAVVISDGSAAPELRTGKGIGVMELVQFALFLKKCSSSKTQSSDLHLLDPLAYAQPMLADWMQHTRPDLIQQGLVVLREQLHETLRNPLAALSFTPITAHPDPQRCDNDQKWLYVIPGLHPVLRRSGQGVPGGSPWTRSVDILHAQLVAWLLFASLQVWRPRDVSLQTWELEPDIGSRVIWKLIHVCSELIRLTWRRHYLLPLVLSAKLIPQSRNEDQVRSRLRSLLSAETRASWRWPEEVVDLTAVTVATGQTITPSTTTPQHHSSVTKQWFIIHPNSSAATIRNELAAEGQLEYATVVISPWSIQKWGFKSFQVRLLSWEQLGTDAVTQKLASDPPKTCIFHLTEEYWSKRTQVFSPASEAANMIRWIMNVAVTTKLVLLSHLPHPTHPGLFELFKAMEYWPYYDESWLTLFEDAAQPSQASSSSEESVVVAAAMPTASTASIRYQARACASLTAMEHAAVWMEPPGLSAPHVSVCQVTDLEDLADRLQQRFCTCREHDPHVVRSRIGPEGRSWAEQRCEEWGWTTRPGSVDFVANEVWSCGSSKLRLQALMGTRSETLIPHVVALVSHKPDPLACLTKESRDRWFKELETKCEMLLLEQQAKRLTLILTALFPGWSQGPNTSAWTMVVLQLNQHRDAKAWIQESHEKLLKKGYNKWMVLLDAICKEIMDQCQSVSDPYCSWRPEWRTAWQMSITAEDHQAESFQQENKLDDENAVWILRNAKSQEILAQLMEYMHATCRKKCVRVENWFADTWTPVQVRQWLRQVQTTDHAKDPHLILCDSDFFSVQDMGLVSFRPWILVQMQCSEQEEETRQEQPEEQEEETRQEQQEEQEEQ